MPKERQSALYTSKVVLAPMVRVCSLPMRLLALDYGADLVYTEEIIDRKLLICQECKNELLGTTDFTMSDGTVVFRTCAAEKGKVIFQIGTSDAQKALAAAKKIQHLVAGVDVNMGCPKEFSIKGGMGAALLTQPDKVRNILTTLVNGLDVPVTCKIRVLPDVQQTVELAKLIESTGVSAIGVHGRTKHERSKDANRDDYIKAVTKVVSIPVIANGGSRNITSLSEAESFRQNTGASSVMLARAAMWNCSVFRKDGPLAFLDVLKSYLRYAFLYDNNVMNTKYCVLQIIHDKMTELAQADPTLSAKSLQEFSDIWGMEDEFRSIMEERQRKEARLLAAEGGEGRGVKKRKMENGAQLIELPVRFDKTLYNTMMTPKQILNNYCRKLQKDNPVYHTTERFEDRFFKSTVEVDRKLYTNPFWERSKQMAEQSAAICYLVMNGLDDGRLSEPKNESEELRSKWRDIVNRDDSCMVKHTAENAPSGPSDRIVTNLSNAGASDANVLTGAPALICSMVGVGADHTNMSSTVSHFESVVPEHQNKATCEVTMCAVSGVPVDVVSGETDVKDSGNVTLSQTDASSECHR